MEQNSEILFNFNHKYVQHYLKKGAIAWSNLWMPMLWTSIRMQSIFQCSDLYSQIFFLENSYSRPILDQWSLPNIQSGQLNKWQIWFSGFTRLVRCSGKYPEPRFWTISKTSYSPTWRWMVLRRGLKKYMKTSLKMLAFILLMQCSLIHTSFLLSHSPHSIFSATLFFYFIDNFF